MTPQEWLAIPEDKLPTALAEVFTPRPWKHNLYSRGCGTDIDVICQKCDGGVHTFVARYEQGVPGRTVYSSDESCPVPDPITIDWNTAMEWRDKMWIGRSSLETMDSILRCIVVASVEAKAWYNAQDDSIISAWWIRQAQPKHYLIAAALAAEKE